MEREVVGVEKKKKTSHLPCCKWLTTRSSDRDNNIVKRSFLFTSASDDCGIVVMISLFSRLLVILYCRNKSFLFGNYVCVAT